MDILGPTTMNIIVLSFYWNWILAKHKSSRFVMAHSWHKAGIFLRQLSAM